MNYLPLILIFLIANIKDKKEIKEVFSSFGEEDIYSIFSLFISDENACKNLSSLAFSLINGNGDFSQILQSIAPLAFTFLSGAKQKEQNKEEVDDTPSFCVEDEEINSYLKDYFSAVN